jgi:hypothetical protein
MKTTACIIIRRDKRRKLSPRSPRNVQWYALHTAGCITPFCIAKPSLHLAAFVFTENQYNERTAIPVGTIRASKTDTRTDIDSLVTAVSFHPRGCRCGGYEQFSFLGCNAVWLAEGQTFRNNISHSSTLSKIKPNKTPVEAGKCERKTCPCS